jgi:hypothetical protein
VPVTIERVGFYRRVVGGWACVVCDGQNGAHAEDCALVTLRGQVAAVVGELGLYVALTSELLERVDAVLRGETMPPSEG